MPAGCGGGTSVAAESAGKTGQFNQASRPGVAESHRMRSRPVPMGRRRAGKASMQCDKRRSGLRTGPFRAKAERMSA